MVKYSHLCMDLGCDTRSLLATSLIRVQPAVYPHLCRESNLWKRSAALANRWIQAKVPTNSRVWSNSTTPVEALPNDGSLRKRITPLGIQVSPPTRWWSPQVQNAMAFLPGGHGDPHYQNRDLHRSTPTGYTAKWEGGSWSSAHQNGDLHELKQDYCNT